MKLCRLVFIACSMFVLGLRAEEVSIQFIRIIDSQMRKPAACNYEMRFNGLIPYKTYVLTRSGSILSNASEKEVLRFQMDPYGMYQCNGKTYMSVGVENGHALISERITYKLFDLSGNLVSENSLVPNPIRAIGKNNTFIARVEFLTPFQFILHWEGIKDGEEVNIHYDYVLEKGETVVIPSQQAVAFGPIEEGVLGLPIRLSIKRSNGDCAELEFQSGVQFSDNFRMDI